MTTVRLRFTKTGEAAYISLLDLQRVMQRAFKRSGLPVWYTQGFNPHIYMTFAAPLALGQESVAESLDFKSETDDFDWSAGPALLAPCLPRGVEPLSMAPARTDPGEIAFARYELRAAGPAAVGALQAFKAYNEAPAALVTKQGKRGKVKELDLKQYAPVLDYKNRGDGALAVSLVLPAGGQLTVSPSLLVGWLCAHAPLQAHQVQILRTELLTGKMEKFR